MEKNCQYGIWKNRLPFHSIPCPAQIWERTTENLKIGKLSVAYARRITQKSTSKQSWAESYSTDAEQSAARKGTQHDKVHVSFTLLLLCFETSLKFLNILSIFF